MAIKQLEARSLAAFVQVVSRLKRSSTTMTFGFAVT